MIFSLDLMLYVKHTCCMTKAELAEFLKFVDDEVHQLMAIEDEARNQRTDLMRHRRLTIEAFFEKTTAPANPGTTAVEKVTKQ